MTHAQVMDWLQGGGWISDICITVWDIALADVLLVLRAAVATRPLIGRALESPIPMETRCGHPHYRGRDEWNAKDQAEWPIFAGGVPSYLREWDVRDAMLTEGGTE